MNWKRGQKDEALDAMDFQRLDELDETTFLGFNKYAAARDHLPVYKSSEVLFQYQN